MIDQGTIALLLKGVNALTWESMVMLGVSFVLFYLAIVKDYEPLLLLPIAAGCMLANLPLSPLIAEDGMLKILYNMGVGNEMFPLLIFIGIGALTDFGPLLENPRLVLLGASMITTNAAAPSEIFEDEAAVSTPSLPKAARSSGILLM